MPALDPIWKQRLTPFEAKCCEALLFGLTLKETAAAIGTTPQVVKNTMLKLYRRFGINEGSRRIHLARRLLGLEGEGAA